MITDINVRVQMSLAPQRLEGLTKQVFLCVRDNCDDVEP